MKMNPLGQTGMTVSEYCLGTMTFGTQTSPDVAHAQIDRALDAGITFVDTAEMYPVNPVRAETVGRTEEIIGDWIARTGRRSDMILATKHSGEGQPHVRNGAPITSKTISGEIDEALARLKTDYIDLYQFHWPNRGSFMFRKNWTFDPTSQDRAAIMDDMEDCLGALQKEMERGRIRAFGLSNETAWGTTQWIEAAKRVGGPRVASLQNEYSLMCRLADTDLAEMCWNENVGLLPYSPLACGYLTGKYSGGAVPEGSRMSINAEMGGRVGPLSLAAADAYVALARDYDLDPVHMALAWSAQRPFVASSIFGATTLAQLDHLLGAIDLELSEELLTAIDTLHRAHPMPY
ncbi:aldo/keto reductase [Marinovum sp. 2_MG-2023]|uniref:aldo/keto reductase n=1 Tax=Roseobacteraceae TaxID=2854170 RepID=UPI001FD0FAC8|nr:MULTISPECIES: aldo/keto reductase [Roseobacteraceae]MCJ7871746.1 aldo/keto reductase [Phaeobacter sp. J2-8]MDO6728585.1 aldo/keto reductase [Marinovum sp. 2_MG-2023]MDO6777999.1 aldo/keto reductase [Marinovum sp. 1_MG-2023]